MRLPTLPIAAVFSVAVLAACSKPAPAPEPVRAVRTVVVQAGTAVAERDYAAEIRARTESRLSFRVGGKMVKRLVDQGASVKAGQVLAQLDPQDLRLSQDAARAAVQSAKVNLDLAQADYDRYRQLRDQGFISGAELERRDTTLKAAQAQFRQAQAQADVQVNQAAYASLVADAGGVITGVDAEPGAVLAAGTPVVRLAHDGPRDAVFAVPEDQVGAMRALLGRAGGVRVKPWSGDAQPLPATVREVAAAADAATRTFQIKADLGTAALRLGQTATVEFTSPPQAGVIKLPLPAVMEKDGRTAVWLLDPASMTVKVQPIVVGGAEGNSVVVASGLQPGQRVVTAGTHVLVPGQKVSLYGEPAAGVAQR